MRLSEASDWQALLAVGKPLLALMPIETFPRVCEPASLVFGRNAPSGHQMPIRSHQVAQPQQQRPLLCVLRPAPLAHLAVSE